MALPTKLPYAFPSSSAPQTHSVVGAGDILGAVVVGLAVLGAAVLGADVLGAVVVGSTVVGTAVAGLVVVGAVVGGGVGLRKGGSPVGEGVTGELTSEALTVSTKKKTGSAVSVSCSSSIKNSGKVLTWSASEGKNDEALNVTASTRTRVSSVASKSKDCDTSTALTSEKRVYRLWKKLVQAVSYAEICAPGPSSSSMNVSSIETSALMKV